MFRLGAPSVSGKPAFGNSCTVDQPSGGRQVTGDGLHPTFSAVYNYYGGT